MNISDILSSGILAGLQTLGVSLDTAKCVVVVPEEYIAEYRECGETVYAPQGGGVPDTARMERNLVDTDPGELVGVGIERKPGFANLS